MHIKQDYLAQINLGTQLNTYTHCNAGQSGTFTKKNYTKPFKKTLSTKLQKQVTQH